MKIPHIFGISKMLTKILTNFQPQTLPKNPPHSHTRPMASLPVHSIVLRYLEHLHAQVWPICSGSIFVCCIFGEALFKKMTSWVREKFYCETWEHWQAFKPGPTKSSWIAACVGISSKTTTALVRSPGSAGEWLLRNLPTNIAPQPRHTARNDHSQELEGPDPSNIYFEGVLIWALLSLWRDPPGGPFSYLNSPAQGKV